VQKPVNVHEAKTHLSRLIERVAAGEEITLARAGRPVARLVPYDRRTAARQPGLLRGQIRMAPDFDSPAVQDEIADLFGR
jgi:prevent-host-death family protein